MLPPKAPCMLLIKFNASFPQSDSERHRYCCLFPLSDTDALASLKDGYRTRSKFSDSNVANAQRERTITTKYPYKGLFTQSESEQKMNPNANVKAAMPTNGLGHSYFVCWITFHFEEFQSAVIGEKNKN